MTGGHEMCRDKSLNKLPRVVDLQFFAEKGGEVHLFGRETGSVRGT